MSIRERLIREDCAKYAALIALDLLESEREAMHKKHGLMGTLYVIAGWAIEFERKTRRVNWEYRSEKTGDSWDIYVQEFKEQKIKGELI